MSYEIHRTLVLSTAHLTPATCNILTNTPLDAWPVAGGPTGYGFYIYAHDEIPDGAPEDLARCLVFARQQARCEYVQFDADCDHVVDLPLFDHGAGTRGAAS